MNTAGFLSHDVEGWAHFRQVQQLGLDLVPRLRKLRGTHPGWGEWSILRAWRGSIAHGTYRPPEDPNSIDDKDLVGICVPPLDHYFGLKDFASKGTQEIMRGDLDVVIYEAAKAIRLLARGNPNMLAILWMPDYLYLGWTNAGTLLVENRDLFATKAAYKPFMGYAQSQMKKMEKGTYTGMGEKRRRLVEQYGYDCKAASHLVRLLRQGQEYLKTGRLQVVRDDAKELLAIKDGEWSLEDVKRVVARETGLLEYAHNHSPLPDAPDLARINKLAVEVVGMTLRERGELESRRPLSAAG